MDPEDAEEELARVVRGEWGRLVALLLARSRRLDLIEDALGDAVEAAARRWPVGGVPDNPAAWLLTVARRRVLDRLRSEAMARRRYAVLVTDVERRPPGAGAMADPGGLVEDDLLRLVLMCTHPALAPEAASALALRLVLGVSTHDIARLFLVPEATMAARITRAKKKIVAAGIPFAVPRADVLPERLATVAQTAYLAFTAGYAPGSGADPVRTELAGEAVRLTTDDSMAEEQVRAGMERAAAEASPLAHTITRWLGPDSPDHAPEISTQEVAAPGWLVACTDGLWNYASEPTDLRAVVRGEQQRVGDDPLALAQALLAWANAQGGVDNITVALARTGGGRQDGTHG